MRGATSKSGLALHRHERMLLHLSYPLPSATTFGLQPVAEDEVELEPGRHLLLRVGQSVAATFM